MYFEGKGNWMIHFNIALDKYNNRVHGTTKMTPFEASNNKLIARIALRTEHASRKNNKMPKLPKFPKFQMRVFVRVPDKRSVYSKVIQQIGIENFSKYTKLIPRTQ